MTLQRVMPWIVASLLLSVYVMLRGAAAGERAIVAAGAAAFALVLIGTSLVVNAYHWRMSAPDDETVPAARRNARLLGLAYAWGALAMQCLYLPRVTGLKWQHGWQYASAMTLLAVLVFGFAHLLGDARRREFLMRYVLPLSAAQGVLAAGSMLFLVVSGKLLTRRLDWAANYVFLTLALMVMVTSAMAMRTQARLNRS